MFTLHKRPEGFVVMRGNEVLFTKSTHEEALVPMLRLSREEDAGWFDTVDRCGIRLAHETKQVRDALLESMGRKEEKKSFNMADAFAALNAAV